MKRWVFLPIVAAVLTSCGPWVRVGGVYRSGSQKYTVELPDRWMRINTVKHLLATRDGLLLQNIVIDRFDVEKPLEHTKKKITMEMLPQEAADVVIDNIRSDPGVLNFQMLESVPVSIDDRSGFKILFSYQNQDGLEFKSIYCGFVAGTWVYVLRYTAPSRHYFHKDVGTFETVLNSFRISEKV